MEQKKQSKKRTRLKIKRRRKDEIVKISLTRKEITSLNNEINKANQRKHQKKNDHHQSMEERKLNASH